MQPAVRLGKRGRFGQPTEQEVSTQTQTGTSREVGTQTDISVVNKRRRRHPLFVPCGCYRGCSLWVLQEDDV